MNIFLSLIWIYSPVCEVYWQYLILRLNLSDFSHSALIFLTNSLEAISLSKVLVALQGCVVRVFAAVVEFRFEFEFPTFTLGSLPHFLLTLTISFCVRKGFQLNVNMHAQYS